VDNQISEVAVDGSQTRWLKVKEIIVDHDVSARVHLNHEAVDGYAEMMKANAVFPPITVFSDGSNYWLADGFHRLTAAKLLRYAEIRAEIIRGDKRDARLFAAQSNITHGLRRTNEDKRRAVSILLMDKEWQQWSDKVIAQKAGVSSEWTSRLRRELVSEGKVPQIIERICMVQGVPKRVSLGVQINAPLPRRTSGKSPNGVDYVKDWRYWLVRFTPAQFLKWQQIVRLRCDAGTLAEAVDIVMRAQLFENTQEANTVPFAVSGQQLQDRVATR
jgi:hypothetical protein